MGADSNMSTAVCFGLPLQVAMPSKHGGAPSSHPSMDMEAGVPTPARDMQLVMYLRVHELDGVPPTATVRDPMRGACLRVHTASQMVHHSPGSTPPAMGEARHEAAI